MSSLREELWVGDALLIADIQNDFLPRGALGVQEGDEILPVLRGYIDRFQSRGLPIFLSQDWHPPNHCSFREQGGSWPIHCVAGSTGALPPLSFSSPETATIIYKATLPDKEAYSAFQDTPLHKHLQAAGIVRLFIGGFATDYCVLHTVRDARVLGYHVCLLTDAIRAVDVAWENGWQGGRGHDSVGSDPDPSRKSRCMNPCSSALLTDLYQLTMVQAYVEQGMMDTAVFEFFVRRLPAQRGFLMAAGLEHVLDFLEHLHVSPAELEWLKQTGRFSRSCLDYLETLRFFGDVDAMQEGTVFFPNEPILRVTAPLPQAQLVETRIMNLLNFQTLIASKAARSVLVAGGKPLIDFGLRRAHGAEAGLLAARASYLAGFAGTATVLAGMEYNIPIYGTMAHSFVQAHTDEKTAFEHFALAQPENAVLLIDTYDTEAAAHKVVALAPSLKQQGIMVKGVRLDSGDLADHARKVRRILDEGGLPQAQILASGNLDEYQLQRLIAGGAPIDSFAVGTAMTTSADAPSLDCAYKLQKYAGRPCRKRSEGKATWPGRKQVYRQYRRDGRGDYDLVTTVQDHGAGDPLLHPVMTEGCRLVPVQKLTELRQRAGTQLALLPDSLRSLECDHPYDVRISQPLQDLALAVDQFV